MWEAERAMRGDVKVYRISFTYIPLAVLRIHPTAKFRLLLVSTT